MEPPQEVDLVVWVEASTGRLRLMDLIPAEADTAAFSQSLLRAVQEPAPGSTPYRPGLVVVDRPELLAAIEPVARSAGFHAELGAVEALEQIASEVEREMARGPGFEYLAFGDVEPREVGAFLEVAMAYFDVEPWNWLCEGDLIRVEGLDPSPVFCSVLGAAGVERGLAIFLNAEAADIFASGQVPERAEEAPALSLTSLAPEEIPIGLEGEILKHGWPIHPEGCALLMRTDRVERPAPTSEELALASRVLEAVVEFVEDGDDLLLTLSSGETVTVRWDDGDNGDVLLFDTAATPAERLREARDVLVRSPDNIPARLTVAELEEPSLEKRLPLLLEAEELGRRAAAAQYEEDLFGHPYLDAVQAVMEALWQLGRQNEAVERGWLLVELDPEASLEARCRLAEFLFTLERYDELDTLWQAHVDDRSLEWLYTGALCEFRRAGRTHCFKRRLKKALKASRAMPDYLLGRRAIPERDPEGIHFGDEIDAENYASRWKVHWERSPGALESLQRAAG
ncbi:MAG: hypothetical protein HY319_03280 [Armatimonadetes bacterium]|nr:hypothetical protein [Armatimonadota bacterium]